MSCELSNKHVAYWSAYWRQ